MPANVWKKKHSYWILSSQFDYPFRCDKRVLSTVYTLHIPDRTAINSSAMQKVKTNPQNLR